jgi:hypothetical protein
MHTFNHNPELMLQLATSSRAEQLDRAARHSAHQGAGRPRRSALGGYWGGLWHRAQRHPSSAARAV